ncbi:hypothetical protein [Flavobacterium davisii]|uniref:Uncharacterized protein n=1 Tax=Flavobacterium columnare TaxID=996 RepID=A0A8G0KSN6_9FLAO|nr:hypothetical protein [Flavobacterium davisii]QYS89467.1 hypothetical protein JJC05_04090 [Flavobacterium davisii]
MKEIIEKISLRARVAFIILCMEKSVKNIGYNVSWDKVFKIFWLQTNIKFVDEWLYEVSKIMPESILEDEYEENITITLEDYFELKKLYKNTPKFIFDLMELAFECGTIDLYGEIENNSDKTMQSVLRCIEIMYNNNIELPNIDLLKKYSISENRGWGREFTKEQIFNESN